MKVPEIEAIYTWKDVAANRFTIAEQSSTQILQKCRFGGSIVQEIGMALYEDILYDKMEKVC